MDPRPSAAGALAPEQYGGPQVYNRAGNAEPGEAVKRNQKGIERVIENGGVAGRHTVQCGGRNNDRRIDQQHQPDSEICMPVAANTLSVIMIMTTTEMVPASPNSVLRKAFIAFVPLWFARPG